MAIYPGQVVLCLGMVLRGSFLQPSDGGRQILLARTALDQDQGKIILGRSKSGPGSFFEQISRAGLVRLNTQALAQKQSKRKLRIRVAQRYSFLIPPGSCFVVARDTQALLIYFTQ